MPGSGAEDYVSSATIEARKPGGASATAAGRRAARQGPRRDRGGRRAFAHGELEARLRPFVARRASPPDVDDVVQDVFLRVQQGLPALREEERFGPWVYQVARSAIAEQRRVRARHPLAGGEPPEVPRHRPTTARRVRGGGSRAGRDPVHRHAAVAVP